jgi:hypothetical protein
VTGLPVRSATGFHTPVEASGRRIPVSDDEKSQRDGTVTGATGSGKGLQIP